MKTLKKLNYTLESQDEWQVDYSHNNSAQMGITMQECGEVTFGSYFRMTQELHNAIEQEMKKRGWWK